MERPGRPGRAVLSEAPAEGREESELRDVAEEEEELLLPAREGPPSRLLDRSELLGP